MISNGSRIMDSAEEAMAKKIASPKAGDVREGVCECHRTGILNRGSGGLGQPDVGFI
jgi:hypothetical protein